MCVYSAIYVIVRGQLLFRRVSLSTSTACRMFECFSSKARVNQKTTSSVDKDLTKDFPNAYLPEEVESKWYEWWLAEGFFKPNQHSTETGNVFTMVMPPPNVTGDLHIGHALAVTIQDVLQRWSRSKGLTCLWVPGYDHAGIATQVVVERKLKVAGTDRHKLGKEAFQNEMQSWTNSKKSAIRQQLQRLGVSVDWSREAFTMDKSFSRAVIEAFVRLHESGLLSRKKTLVNWCCHLQSTISDMEVEHVVISGKNGHKDPCYNEPIYGMLTHFAYPLADGGEVVVATTRPETMLGDVAVAVNASDDRYANLRGKQVVHPFDGRLLPVILSEHVDLKFGTGCVKITPAHSHEDFRLAEEHGLPVLNILNEKGYLESDVASFAGLHRFSARKAVVEELKGRGLFRGQQDHEVSIPICSRSGSIVEPRLKSQWFLETSGLIQQVLQDLKGGSLHVLPDHACKDLFHWLSISSDSDWCLSRQLWWGHQIPAYRLLSCADCDETGAWIVARTLDEAVSKASEKYNCAVRKEQLVQDEDVLDTWFSSSLFPFAVFGWPENTECLQRFYPLSLMETGRDILFFWIVRMLIMGKQLTGALPFTKVLAHGLVCDAHGRKMSKSLGNVVDPLHVIQGISLDDLLLRNVEHHRHGYISDGELKLAQKGLAKNFPNGIVRCGADALRFALCSQDIQDQTVTVDVHYVQSCRSLCNKIWQACRFYLSSIEKTKVELVCLSDVRSHLAPLDKWMLSQVHNMVASCDRHLNDFDLHLVTSALKNFWYFQLCDIYLEGIKPVFNSSEVPQIVCAASVLHACIQTGVIAMAPFMPFLAEELYHRLQLQRKEEEPSAVSVCVARYPSTTEWQEWQNPQLDDLFKLVMNVVHEVRSFKRRFSLPGGKRPTIVLKLHHGCELSKWEEVSPTVETLGRCRLQCAIEMPSFDTGGVLLPLMAKPCFEIAAHLDGSIDFNRIIASFESEKKKVTTELEKSLRQKRNATTNVNDQVQALSERLQQIEATLTNLKVATSKHKC